MHSCHINEKRTFLNVGILGVPRLPLLRATTCEQFFDGPSPQSSLRFRTWFSEGSCWHTINSIHAHYGLNLCICDISSILQHLKVDLLERLGFDEEDFLKKEPRTLGWKSRVNCAYFLFVNTQAKSTHVKVKSKKRISDESLSLARIQNWFSLSSIHILSGWK